jgi:hypothetical protein
MKNILITILTFSSIYIFAQTKYTQTVRGEVLDKNTGIPLIGATVLLVYSDPPVGVVTDEKGMFKIEKVPVGRQAIQVNYIGYKPATLSALYVESGKELVLRISLEENIVSMDEVVIKANGRKDRPINDMAKISARSFTVEETEKYAGSWGDPSRMALNFAGVMAGSDQMNGIIIRGNSPNGLLFRLEGIPIPNPNHFGAMGSTSGPISMLNNNVLSNSDFFTSAFPAQYGNALSGIFDLGLRTGNNEKREFMGQVGFNGFELGAEGPFTSNSKASYIANYRYSTMGVFDALGIDLGIGAIPYYQDLSFKVDIPGTKSGRFSIFGLGGKNNIAFNQDENNKVEKVENSSKMAAGGLSHLIYFSENTRLKTILASTYAGTGTLNTVYKYNILDNWYGDEMSEWKLIASTELKTRINSRNNIVIGANIENIHLNYIDSFWVDQPANLFVHNFQTEGQMNLFQSFAQWQHKFSNSFSVVTGVHLQKTDLNKKTAIEPRAAMEYEFLPGKSLSFGYGLHSRVQPGMIYFREALTDTANQIYSKTNKNLGFSKSHQLVAGYNQKFNSSLRLKVEAYYQYLFDVPVKQYPSFISMVNYESGFYDINYDSLVNEGVGRNYGIEFTFEKFFSNNYYYLMTLSIFDSKYKASDNLWRNTAFNGNFVLNLLGGYEFTINKKNTLTIDSKVVWAGGTRNIPVTLTASRLKNETIHDYEKAYKVRYDDYYKIDLRVGYKLNLKKISMEWAVDITNLTNHKNRFFEIYDSEKDEVVEAGQMGIVPVMLYRIHF